MAVKYLRAFDPRGEAILVNETFVVFCRKGNQVTIPDGRIFTLVEPMEMHEVPSLPSAHTEVREL